MEPFGGAECAKEWASPSPARPFIQGEGDVFVRQPGYPFYVFLPGFL